MSRARDGGCSDEDSCYRFLLSVLHPRGLACPRGHLLPADQSPHDRHRAPVVDYRCRQCGAVFNVFTGTALSHMRYSCKTAVSILSRLEEGVPTTRVAAELSLDRSHLNRRRPAFQTLVDQGLFRSRRDRTRRR